MTVDTGAATPARSGTLANPNPAPSPAGTSPGSPRGPAPPDGATPRGPARRRETPTWGTAGRRLPALLLALLLAVAALAGCLSGETGSDTSPAGEEAADPAGTQAGPDLAGFNETTSLEVGLADVPEGADGVLLTVVLSEPGSLRLEVESRMTLRGDGPGSGDSPERICRVTWVGDALLAFQTDGFRREAGWRMDGRGDRATVRPFSASWNTQEALAVRDAPAGVRVSVVLGVGNSTGWQEAGGALDATLESEAPFHWRLQPLAGLRCGEGPDDFAGGDYAQAEGTTAARDLRAEFGFREGGLLLPFVQTDGSFAGEIVGPQGPHWSDEWTQLDDATELRYGFARIFDGLRPGAWELRVGELAGASDVTVGYFAADLPGWAHPGAQEDAIRS